MKDGKDDWIDITVSVVGAILGLISAIALALFGIYIIARIVVEIGKL